MTAAPEDPTTQAVIRFDNWFNAALGVAQPVKQEIVNTVGFTYSSDVLNLGDPFAFRIANPNGRYNEVLQRGAKVEFFLKNPNVNGGNLTLKHTGIVVNRTLTCDRSGDYIDIQAADLGYHLTSNDAPLYYVLQGGTLERLLKDPKFIDPSWGLQGPVTDHETSVLIRRGLNNSRAQYSIDMAPLGTLVRIQVEPGDKIVDLVTTYTRRIGRMFTVSPDGYMQIWKCGNEKLLYALDYHGFYSTDKTTNNLIDLHITEDISSVYTVVTCVGEIVGGTLAADTTNQNAAKRIGTFTNSFALPFRHNLNFCDGDVFDSSAAKKQALWKYNRGIFDSWAYIATVRGHHQNGNWWESGTLCQVLDSVNGVQGLFYVQSVVYTRDEQGDRTQVTLRKNNLLQASYGVFARPPRVSAPTNLPAAATEGPTNITTTKAS